MQPISITTTEPMSSEMKSLINTFNIILNQYNETYEKLLYITNYGAPNELIPVQNFAFVSDTLRTTSTQACAIRCQEACAADPLCIGGTFSQAAKTCVLNGGANGELIQSTGNTAIARQAMYYTHQLREMNAQLTRLNTQMLQLSKQDASQYTQTRQLTEEKALQLHATYDHLQQERSKIDDMIAQQTTLQSAMEGSSLRVSSAYYQFVMYMFLAAILIYILLYVISTGPSSEQVDTSFQMGGRLLMDNKKIVLYSLLAAIILLNAYLNTRKK